jgi:endonuclease/exonuclease/phosphatase family metal-dependent hydrolase
VLLDPIASRSAAVRVRLGEVRRELRTPADESGNLAGCGKHVTVEEYNAAAASWSPARRAPQTRDVLYFPATSDDRVRARDLDAMRINANHDGRGADVGEALPEPWVRDHRTVRDTMRTLFVAAFAALALAGPAQAATPATENQLSVVSFNVLAPVWAAPDWYPEEMDSSLLDNDFRRPRIMSFLASRASTTDIFCLQEVQESELPYFLEAVGSGFTGAMGLNDPDWWSSWVVPEIPWAPNGTALLVRRGAFSSIRIRDIALSGDGDHGALFEGVERASGRRVRAASVHLDSDVQANRNREAKSLMTQMPVAAGTVDVVCGDINEDAVNGAASGIFQRAGFSDALAAVGNREPTHPWDTQYNGSPRWSIIDHVIVRDARPLSGDVYDFGVYAIEDETERIEANFRNTGSDHFPIGAVAGF